jgi:hypothetical protein
LIFDSDSTRFTVPESFAPNTVFGQRFQSLRRFKILVLKPFFDGTPLTLLFLFFFLQVIFRQRCISFHSFNCLDLKKTTHNFLNKNKRL